MTYAQQPMHQRRTAWVGWGIFAAAMLVVAGLFSIVEGLAGIFRDEQYFLGVGGDVLVFDYTAWGWIHLIIGVVLVAIGFGIIAGSAIARAAAIFVVWLNMLAQFAWINAYPWWSLIVIALDVVIIYALVVHGREMNAEA